MGNDSKYISGTACIEPLCLKSYNQNIHAFVDVVVVRLLTMVAVEFRVTGGTGAFISWSGS